MARPRDDEKHGSRRKSELVRTMLTNSGHTKMDLANYLCCTRQYVDDKLFRNSFTVEDIVITAHMCGYELKLTDKSGRELLDLGIEYFFGVDDQINILNQLKALDRDTI